MQLVPNIFGKISLSGEALADLIFFLVTAYAAVMSAILLFHWRRYGMGGAGLATAEVFYFGVSVALLAAAFFSLN